LSSILFSPGFSPVLFESVKLETVSTVSRVGQTENR